MAGFLSGLIGKAAPAGGPGGNWRSGSQGKALDVVSTSEAYERALARATGMGSASSWGSERALREGYRASPYVYRAVETYAEAGSQRLIKSTVDPEGKPQDHPLLRVLNGKANPAETGPDLLHRVSQQLHLSERGAVAEYVLSNGGTVLRIDLLPYGITVPVPDSSGAIDHWEVRDPKHQRPRTVEPDRVLWWKLPDPDNPWMSMTPLKAAGIDAEIERAARIFVQQYLRNDGGNGTVIGVEGDFEDDEIEELDRRVMRGPMNAGKPLFLSGRLTYVNGGNPRDAQHVQTSAVSKAGILAAFQLPESVLGNASGKTFANAHEEIEGWWSGPAPAHLTRILQPLQPLWDGDGDLHHDLSTVPAVQRIRAKRREEDRAEVAEGLRSVAEYRGARGLETPNPDDALHGLLIPAGREVVRLLPSEPGQEVAATTSPDSAPRSGNDGGPTPPDPEAAETSTPPEAPAAPAAGQPPQPAAPTSQASLFGEEGKAFDPDDPLEQRIAAWVDSAVASGDSTEPDWLLPALEERATAVAQALHDELLGLPERKALRGGTLAARARDAARRVRDALVAAVKERLAGGGDEPEPEERGRWAEAVAGSALHATGEGGATAGAETAARIDPGIERTWLTRLDDRVRDAHTEAHGQKRNPGQPYAVGGFPMDYPGDQNAPLHLWINCRCRQQWRSKATGRWITAPRVTQEV